MSFRLQELPPTRGFVSSVLEGEVGVVIEVEGKVSPAVLLQMPMKSSVSAPNGNTKCHEQKRPTPIKPPMGGLIDRGKNVDCIRIQLQCFSCMFPPF